MKNKINSQYEVLFELLLKEKKIPYEREYMFHVEHIKSIGNISTIPHRFRFDFAILDKKIGIEIEGGIWAKGRHNRPKGFINDCIKYNLATSLGWKVFRIPTDFFTNKIYYPSLKEIINGL